MANGDTADGDTFLMGATVLCGRELRMLRNATIHLRGGEVPVPEGARVVDLGGYFVTAGLCDVNVHYSQSGWVDSACLALICKTPRP
ncbi:hypothetical protein T492DRAFT_873263 [Pavlovales sp. CCMP2436]|nr:hypothetical protein T492DRAFT_873263 [Pavlovales sp. CCMP2436]